jgi:aspartyl-tRNA(Asn)/glutamyl-tRNA(Gln) amidotransferase subunit A
MPAKGLRVAWSPRLGYARPKPEVLEIVTRAVGEIEARRRHVEEVEAVFDGPLELFMAEFLAGAGTRLRPVLEDQRELLDPAVARTLDGALAQTMDQCYTTVFKRYDLRTKLCSFFENYDLLLTPTLPTEAFDAEADFSPDLGSPDNILDWIYYTYPFNLTGAPAASIHPGRIAGGPPDRGAAFGRGLDLPPCRSFRGSLPMGRSQAVAVARQASRGHGDIGRSLPERLGAMPRCSMVASKRSAKSRFRWAIPPKSILYCNF